jgi:hypothetical protein
LGGLLIMKRYRKRRMLPTIIQCEDLILMILPTPKEMRKEGDLKHMVVSLSHVGIITATCNGEKVHSLFIFLVYPFSSRSLI